jgi:hypothetical protein
LTGITGLQDPSAWLRAHVQIEDGVLFRRFPRDLALRPDR